ncbi:helix-turn-helix domain-containing protein [Streptomyces diastatochromogenes]|uniref:helix-turn-helix domain-containing protein n=1 Tax=Streptomyces diastatochromogenes TaxID=42236 RepID=UPI003699847A
MVHAFAERGFDALDPKWSGGRPRAISERVHEHIRLIARTSPADRGITGFATWHAEVRTWATDNDVELVFLPPTAHG